MKMHEDEDQLWTGREAARRFIIWLVLWIVIDLLIVTWVFMYPRKQPNVMEPVVFSRDSAGVPGIGQR